MIGLKKRKDSIVNLKPIFSTITVTYKTVKGVKKQINTLDYVCPECKRLFTGKTDNCPNCKVELDWNEEK